MPTGFHVHNSSLHRLASAQPAAHILFKHPVLPWSLFSAQGPRASRPSCTAQGVTQQRGPAVPKSSNDDPLDNVLAGLQHVNKKRRAPKSQAPASSQSSRNSRPPKSSKGNQKTSRSSGRSRKGSTASSSMDASCSTVLKGAAPSTSCAVEASTETVPEAATYDVVEASSALDETSFGYDESRSSIDEEAPAVDYGYVDFNSVPVLWGFLTPDRPGPNQQSIDEALGAVMAKLGWDLASPQAQQQAAAAHQALRQGSTVAVKEKEEEKEEETDHQGGRVVLIERKEVPASSSISSSTEGEGRVMSSSSSSKDAAAPTPNRQQRKKGGRLSSRSGSSSSEVDGLLQDELNMSKEEREKLFNQIYLSVSGLEDLEDDSSGKEDLGSSSQSAEADKGRPAFKGFDPRPALNLSAAAQDSVDDSATPGKRPDGSRPPFPADSSVPPLPVFLYCAEVATTNDVIVQLGLEQHIKVVENLKEAQAVLSVKMGKGGKQNNLQQGKRTANNQGIPFVCVGRRMTQETLLPAIAKPLLNHRAQYGQNMQTEGARDDLTHMLLAAAATAEKQVQLQPGWAHRMMSDLGM